MQTDTGSNVCCYDRLWHGGARHTLWKGLWQQAAGLDGALWHHGSCGGPPVLAGRTPSHPGSVVHCWCCWRWVHLSPWLCLVQFSGENGKSRSYTTLNLPVGLVNVTEFVPAVWFLYIFFSVWCLLCPFVSRCINLKCVGPQSGVCYVPLSAGVSTCVGPQSGVCYVPLSVGVSTWNVWAPSQVSVMSLRQQVYQLEMCGPPVRCLLCPLVSRCINLKCGGPQWEASQPLNGCSGVCCALLSTTKSVNG